MKTAWLFALLLCLTSSVCPPSAQDSPKPPSLEPRAHTFSGIFPALEALKADYKIRFGLETFDDQSDRGKVSLVLSGGDIRRILDDLVKQRPGYEWTLEDGIYDVYPTDASKRLSDLSIALYDVREANADDISEALDELPELREWLSLHKVKRSEFLTGRRSESTRKINLELRAVTLRTVLNETAKALGDRHWMIIHYGDNLQFVGIYF